MAALHIGRVRIHGEPSQATALRLAVSAQLQAAELEPPSAPPSAVLLVRQLRDPLPGRLRTRGGIPGVDGDWERAVRRHLDSLYTRAVRPATGSVSSAAVAAAEAVKFRDEVELLTCLLEESPAQPRRRWFWRTLARARPALRPWLAGGSLVPYLASVAQHLPAALSALPEGRAMAQVGALDSAQCGTLIGALVDAHALPSSLWQRPRSSLGGAGPATGQRAKKDLAEPSGALPSGAGSLEEGVPIPKSTGSEERAPREAAGASGADFDGVSSAPPWRPWLAASVVASLDPGQELLLGLALGLAREPSASRTSCFAEEAGRYLDPSAFSRSPASRPSDGRPPSANAEEHGAGDLGSAAAARFSQAAEDGFLQATLPGERSADLLGGGPEEAGSPLPGSDRDAGTAAQRTNGRSGGPGEPGLSGDMSPSPAELDSGRPSAGSSTEPGGSPRQALSGIEFRAGLATRLGGAVYLVNLMLREGILAHSDSRAHESWALPDPLEPWAAVEALARGLLGEEASPSELDDPLWSALAAVQGRPERQPPTSLARDWLDPILDPLTRRLACLLDSPSPRQAGGLLLRIPGTLHIGPTHVDLVASLDVVNLNIRRAGLDLDPGWVPALGRVVTIHYR